MEQLLVRPQLRAIFTYRQARIPQLLASAARAATRKATCARAALQNPTRKAATA